MTYQVDDRPAATRDGNGIKLSGFSAQIIAKKSTQTSEQVTKSGGYNHGGGNDSTDGIIKRI